jgi:hypothetical protein
MAPLPPPWLRDDDPSSFAHIDHAAVAIMPLGAGRSHVGLLFRENEEKGRAIRLLHLAFHHRLRDDDPAELRAPIEQLAWIETKIPPERLEMVAAMCRLVRERQRSRQEVPYALRYARTRFDGKGDLVLGAGEHGLTCATFVLAVFDAAQLALVEVETWPTRPEDRAWQEEIVRILRGMKGVSNEHIEAVGREVGCARFRPEEVAGASSHPAPPVGFELAESAAAQIRAAFDPPMPLAS